MTDNEIIKALECCRYAISETECNHCPYCECTSDKGCNGEMIEDALDLINRQKAEINNQRERCSQCGERTTKAILNMQKAFSEQSLENERLKIEVERLKKDNEYILMQHAFQRRPSGDCWNDVIEKSKAEAIKKFAEKSENKILSMLTSATLEKKETISFCLDYIDETVKEMVGEIERDG